MWTTISEKYFENDFIKYYEHFPLFFLHVLQLLIFSQKKKSYFMKN